MDAELSFIYNYVMSLDTLALATLGSVCRSIDMPMPLKAPKFPHRHPANSPPRRKKRNAEITQQVPMDDELETPATVPPVLDHGTQFGFQCKTSLR